MTTYTITAGNLAGDGNTGSTPNFSYDAANRLLSVNYGSSSYEYDGDGRRVKGVSGGVTTFQLWSSVLGQPVADLTASGTLYRAYVHSSSGQMLALQATDSNFYWLHTDHLGSGRKLTNTSGTVVYRAEFDPHGQTLYEWAQAGSSQYNLNSHKFTGYERDASNIDNANARAFYHNRGRFTQADPLGLGAADLANPQSLNLYGYVGNDPVNFVDPSGLNRQLCTVITINGHWERDGDWVGDDSFQIRFCTTDPDSYVSGGGGEIERGGGGGGEVLTTPPQRNPICDKLEKEIDEFVNRDKRQNGDGGTHGLVHRFREQINGANGPGTDSWKNHEDTIKNQQKGLRDRLNEWNKNGCGPPPPTSWKWATAPVPSPNEWIGNRGPAGQQVNTRRVCPTRLTGNYANRLLSQ